jgi:tRNA(Ile)-lysidine synthase
VLKSLLTYIRAHELVHAGDRVGLAVSGGADSVALLRATLALRSELGVILSVVHVNHGLRGAESDADEAFVADLAREHKLPLHSTCIDVRAYAAEHKLSIEAAARAVRYEYFRGLIPAQVNRIATAHTMDDQAETVLLRLLRGAGTRGLAGIYRTVTGDDAEPGGSHPIEIATAPEVRIIRPLLETSRAQVLEFLGGVGQRWREDASNQDRAYLRNRVRHDLLPLLEREFNPNLRAVLAQTAEVARDEERWWAKAVAEVFDSRAILPGDAFPVTDFAALEIAMQRRVLRAMAESASAALDFGEVERARAAVLEGSAGSQQVSAALAIEVRRHRDGPVTFRLHPQGFVGEKQGLLYDYALTVPGVQDVPELGFRLRAERVTEEVPGSLTCALAGRMLHLRNWRAGDRFHAEGRGSEKKLKELFQLYRIPAAERTKWPVIECAGEIVWVRGLPPSVDWRARPGERFALLFELLPLS